MKDSVMYKIKFYYTESHAVVIVKCVYAGAQELAQLNKHKTE